MNKQIHWEKWDEADFITDSLGDEEDVSEEELDMPSMHLGTFSLTFPKIRTPLGFFSIDDPLRPSIMFDCWIGHTNFDITNEVKQLIEKTPGIEAFRVMSRYRFFIGIGKLFKFRHSAQLIQSALNVTLTPKEAGGDDVFIDIIKKQLKSYKRWAIFCSKDGLLEYAASNDDNDPEFEAAVNKFLQDENFTVIKSEDEE